MVVCGLRGAEEAGLFLSDMANSWKEGATRVRGGGISWPGKCSSKTLSAN